MTVSAEPRLPHAEPPSTFAKCRALVGDGNKWRWVGLVASAMVVSGFEAVGASAIYLLMSLVTAPDEPVAAPLIGDIRERFPGASNTDLVVIVASVLAVFFIIRATAVVLSAYVQHRVSYNSGANLSVRLLRGYLAMPYEFHLQRNSAELIRNAFDTVQVFVREVLAPLARVATEALVTLGVVAVLFATAPRATLVALVVLGPSSALLLGVVHPWLKRLGATSQEMSAASLQSLAQSLEGVRDITILGRQSAFKKEFTRQRKAFARANYVRGGAREIPRAAIETLLVLFILGFFVATELTGNGGPAALSVLGLFAYSGLRLKPSLSNVMSGLNSARFAASAIDDLYEDLMLVEREGRPRPRVVQPLPLKQKIEIRDLRFSFNKRYDRSAVHGTVDEADRPVLDGVNATILRGKSVGIVGPTGGGKSTLVDCIIGLLTPESGEVLVDGTPIHDHVAEWQASIGVVPQTVFLIDGTLRSNVCLGLDDDVIDDAALQSAVDQAQLRKFVDELPDGMDTWVGERGVRVSGGQRQRIAIARALYGRPDVLVFDEGTSALDNLTEAELVRELDALKGERTIITIAHRLSTVRSCDEILLLESGRIVDRGTYDDLMTRSDRFRAMALAGSRDGDHHSTTTPHATSGSD